MDEYDVYEIWVQQSDEIFLLAHARSEKKLEEVHTRVSGYLRELQVDEEDDSEKLLYLEAYYYTPLLQA